jgi:hypothetical protein
VNNQDEMPTFRELRREPAAESDDIYPGLSVNDGRQGGLIVVDRGRLPLSAFLRTLARAVWNAVIDDYPHIPEHYEFTAAALGDFLTDLLEQHGEMARLLLVLADAQRRERESLGVGVDAPAWWSVPDTSDRVGQQLALCMRALDRVDLEEAKADQG